jgi:hypothetical protein
MQARSQFVGSAGQYYLAYCLTVRGFHAAITLGNVPNVDVVVANATGSRLLSVQVKTSRWAYRPNRYGYELREWDVGGAAVGKSAEGLWYAFIDLQGESPTKRTPLVFFVPSLWVGSFVQHDWSRKMYMLRSEVWDGCQERWDRIEGYLNTDPEALAWCTTIPEAAKDWASAPKPSSDTAARPKSTQIVMAGLDPAIHVDARHKAGHDKLSD